MRTLALVIIAFSVGAAGFAVKHEASVSNSAPVLQTHTHTIPTPKTIKEEQLIIKLDSIDNKVLRLKYTVEGIK